MASIWNTFDEYPNSTFKREQIYNALDACITHEVFLALEPQLDELTSRTYDLERALQAPILEMMLRGVRIDLSVRDELISMYRRQNQELQETLDEILRDGLGVEPINPGSWQQKQHLLYEVLGLPHVRKRGKITTDRSALERLSTYFQAEPICRHIMVLQDVRKKLGFLKTGIGSDGRCRTTFNIAGTDTGRLSSYGSCWFDGTNMQNISPEMRRMFVADEGMKFAYVDLEQAEARVVGAILWNLFHDGKYLDFCESGDLHTNVTKMCWQHLGWDGSNDKTLAKQNFYREFTYRDASKRLGHACVTDDHEVLTRQGWVSVKEKPTEILCFRNNTLRFDSVLNWIDEPYKGTMISLEGTSISQLLTPNHRIIFSKDPGGSASFHEVEAGQARFSSSAAIPLGWGYHEPGVFEPYAKIIAAVQADGSLRENKKPRFHFHKERKFERLIKLCEEVGIAYTRQGEFISLDWIMPYPKEAGSYLLNWNYQSLQSYSDEHRYWDGHISKTYISISSTKRTHLEWIQTINRLLGKGGNISKPTLSGFGSYCYSLQENSRRWATCKSLTKTLTEFEGNVYCPTVQSGIFLIRRQGKISLTGNSNYHGQPPQISREVRIPVGLVQEFQRNYFREFPAISRWHEEVRIKLLRQGWITSLLGRRRWFFGRRWDNDTLNAAIAYDPQSSIADYLDSGLLRTWIQCRNRGVQLLLQEHDAILFQFPESLESELVPAVQQLLEIELPLFYGRTLTIPTEALVGWNWGYAGEGNPDGLISFGGDTRKRSTPTHFLDRQLL